MSEKLKLAESYYAVARDLARQGKWYIEVAEQLDKLADSLCEQNIRETVQRMEESSPHPTSEKQP